MQIGGWYNNPATGTNQRYWGGNTWTDGSDPTGGATSSGTISQSDADKFYNDTASKENAYIDSLKAQSQGQLDLMLKKLDTEHKLALGNGDDNGAKFLESVANNLESQIGRIPYDYQRYTDRELKSYALGNTAIAQNKQNALDKLANDEKTLAQTQGQSNVNTVEDLNQRGLMYGQTPTGGMNPTPSTPTAQPLTGMGGVAGQTANTQNANFGTQWNANAIAGQGINNTFGQQQSTLDLNHANTLEDLTTGARRDAQDANNADTFGTQQAQLTYDQQMATLERQRQQNLLQDKMSSSNLVGQNKGVLGM